MSKTHGIEWYVYLKCRQTLVVYLFIEVDSHPIQMTKERKYSILNISAGGEILTIILTYLLTPWCRFLLEKLTGWKLVKKFPAFYGTRSFITALTSVRHLSLSWASPIQSINPHPTSWRSILTLFSHLRLGLPSGLFPSGYRSSSITHTLRLKYLHQSILRYTRHLTRV